MSQGFFAGLALGLVVGSFLTLAALVFLHKTIKPPQQQDDDPANWWKNGRKEDEF